MSAPRFLQAIALDLCVAALGMAIVAIPMAVIGIMS